MTFAQVYGPAVYDERYAWPMADWPGMLGCGLLGETEDRTLQNLAFYGAPDVSVVTGANPDPPTMIAAAPNDWYARFNGGTQVTDRYIDTGIDQPTECCIAIQGRSADVMDLTGTRPVMVGTGSATASDGGFRLTIMSTTQLRLDVAVMISGTPTIVTLNLATTGLDTWCQLMMQISTTGQSARIWNLTKGNSTAVTALGGAPILPALLGIPAVRCKIRLAAGINIQTGKCDLRTWMAGSVTQTTLQVAANYAAFKAYSLARVEALAI